jgi:hypothetical protein
VSASLLMAAAGLLGSTPTAQAYDAVSVADGGSIKGKVVFNGTLPPKRKIVPTKDREVCGSGVREVDQILVGGDKSVQDAIVYLKAVEKGKAWPKLAKTPEIDNVKCDFQPHVMVMPVGDIVVVNTDPVLHNTKSFIDRVPIFNLALPNQGQRITRPIKKSGIMRVECDAHGWMLGWVYVADNPYYAITPKDGSFSITDIPPGTYTLVAWQEFTGPTETPITIKGKEATSITVELKK